MYIEYSVQAVYKSLKSVNNNSEVANIGSGKQMKLKKTNSVVILCGGRGTRLGNLGKTTPKALVNIHKKPIIWYIINTLIKKGFNHFILPTGYKSKKIKDYIKKNSKKNQNIKFNIVETGENTSISERIYRIKDFIISDNFVLLNGDAIFDFNLKQIFNLHKYKKSKVTFIGCEAILNYGIVGIVNNKITSFERDLVFNSVKCKRNKKFMGYIYSGISIMNKEVLKHNFKDFQNFEKEFYPIVIKKYKTIFKELLGKWYSIDNQKDINLLNEKKNSVEYNFIKKLKSHFSNEKKFLV